MPIDVEGRTVYAYNVHFTDYPYQPYQLLKIPYGEAPFLSDEKAAVQAAEAARGPALKLLLEDLRAAAGATAFVFGDFNEPSHRDWTQRAVAAGKQPMVVAWPTSLALEQLGFTDALRAAHPDEVAKPAFTWTPSTEPTDPADHHDRIDFVMVRGGRDVTPVVEQASVVGEKNPEADIVVAPYPSDHRAVVVRLSL